MKSKYVVLTAALLVSLSNFAQKDQIKAAEKALKNGNSAEAISVLTQAETSIGAAEAAEKAQFYFVKGNAHIDLANKKTELSKNLSEAAKAYQEVLSVEKTSGKSKYTSQAQSAIADIKNQLINAAVDAGNSKDYKTAAKMLYQTYELDKTDIEKLYYAGNYAFNGEDYETALRYYEECKKLNYSGEGMGYYAKSAINEQEEFFGSTAASKTDRDTKVRLKLYTNPRDEKIPSKKGEILKNIALILVQQGKIDQAKLALSDARAANPDDTSIAMTEANVYLELNDFAMYKTLVTEVLAKNPNDADLLYNLGVIASKTNASEAEGYYKKAIEINPNFTNAYLNLAILKLDADKKMIEEMNKLGTSEKDNKRYEVLKKQRSDMFNSALPYLEKAFDLDPKNEDVATTLLNVYGALEMTDKKKALKAKLGK
jgi:tetratricopeptide (TPR) repeat protein